MASRGVFNIKGLGERTVSALVDGGFLKDIADVFALTKENMFGVEGFAEKSSLALEREIKESRKVDFGVFIQSLGIRHVGEQTAGLLAARFKSVEDFFRADSGQFSSIKGIGKETASSIIEFTSGKTGIELKDKMIRLGVEVNYPGQSEDKDGVAGKTFVITGKLEGISRAEARQAIRRAGGIAASSVSSKTDYLVEGTESGSKLEKAKSLGVRIINEKDLKEML